CGNLPGEVVFLDEQVRPDRLQQLVFADCTAAGLEQHEQHLKGAGRQRHGFATVQYGGACRVYGEDAERERPVSCGVVTHDALPVRGKWLRLESISCAETGENPDTRPRLRPEQPGFA